MDIRARAKGTRYRRFNRISYLRCCLLPFLLFGIFGMGHTQVDSLLRVLDKRIDALPEILAGKYADIQALRLKLKTADQGQDRFRILSRLCKEYQSFRYDTAYLYAVQLVELATQLEQPEYVVRAKTQAAFILTSGGLFHEALDLLSGLDLVHCSQETRSKFYYTRARSYFDLGDFYGDVTYRPRYYREGMASLDSAILFAIQPLTRLSYRGMRARYGQEPEQALSMYRKLVENPELPSRQLAIEASSLSYVHRDLGHPEKALWYMIIAAIADVENSVKESIALMELALEFYHREDYERSDHYIELALADANFYNARQRKPQILEVLPIIKARQVELSEAKRKQWFYFFFLTAALLGICLVLIFANIRKNRELKHKEVAISRAYEELAQYTRALTEADRIKDTYIGHFFQGHTRFINKMDKLFGQARKALAEHKLKDAQYHLKQFNARREHRKLQEDFDRAFLVVFPNFVAEFNQLFPPEHHFSLPEAEERLNTELRIFALIRLGVKSNETIARALDYSVNTIYAYKTKLRNRSHLDSEAFDRAVMAITGVEEDPGALSER